MKYRTYKSLNSLIPAVACLERHIKEYQSLTPAELEDFGVLARDGVLQMFMVSTNIMLRTLRAYLLDQRCKVAVNPEIIIKTACEHNLISDRSTFSQMLHDSRGVLTTLDEDGMARIYAKIPTTYLPILKTAASALQNAG